MSSHWPGNAQCRRWWNQTCRKVAWCRRRRLPTSDEQFFQTKYFMIHCMTSYNIGQVYNIYILWKHSISVGSVHCEANFKSPKRVSLRPGQEVIFLSQKKRWIPSTVPILVVEISVIYVLQMKQWCKFWNRVLVGLPGCLRKASASSNSGCVVFALFEFQNSNGSVVRRHPSRFTRHWKESQPPSMIYRYFWWTWTLYNKSMDRVLEIGTEYPDYELYCGVLLFVAKLEDATPPTPCVRFDCFIVFFDPISLHIWFWAFRMCSKSFWIVFYTIWSRLGPKTPSNSQIWHRW